MDECKPGASGTCLCACFRGHGLHGVTIRASTVLKLQLA